MVKRAREEGRTANSLGSVHLHRSVDDFADHLGDDGLS